MIESLIFWINSQYHTHLLTLWKGRQNYLITKIAWKLISSKTETKSINLILETIKSDIKPPTYPVTIHNIQQFVLDKIGISVNKRKIKAYLKDSINYSYKKGSTRSITLKLNSCQIQKSVFSSRMFRNIYNNKLIVNIDESSF